MAFSRALLLKGLAGAATVGAVGGGVVLGGNLFKSNRKVNDKLGSLGLEDDCLLKDDEDSTAFSKECSLDLERLKKIRFSNKGEGELKVVGQVPQELKLKIEGNKEDISFSFKGISSSPLAIVGDKSKGKIVIKGEEQKFKEKDGKLTKVSLAVDGELKSKLEEFNKQLGEVDAPVECRYDEAETDASVECSVTEEDLKVIKFSGLGEGELKVEGEVSAGLKLKAERDQENAMSLYFTGLGENLTIYGDQKSEGIVIKSGKKFRVGEDGKLEKVTTVVTPELKAKAKEFNGQLGKVKAPLSCRFDEGDPEEAVECSITHDQLKKMEFSNKLARNDLKIVGSVDPDLKLKVERDGEDAISLSFPQQTTELKIFGREDEGKIILNNDKKFKVANGKLTKENPNGEIKKLNKQLWNVKAPFECRFDEAEVEDSVDCVVTQKNLEEMKFSNVGTENLKIVGWPTSGTIKLRAEKDSQNKITLSFPGLGATPTSPVTIYGYKFKGKIVIKSEEQKFKVVDSQITKESSNVDETLKSELEEFNEKLGEVNVPVECRFDEAEVEESVECDVNKDNLRPIAFSTGNWWDLTYGEGEDFSGMKLKVQIVKTFGEDGNEDGKVLILTFKDYQKTVKLQDENKKKIISFVKNTNPEFLIDGDEEDSNSILLAKKWDPDDVVDLFDLDCGYDDGNTPLECSFNEDEEVINVGKGTEDEFEELTIEDTDGKSFELHAEEEGYNQGYRFVFKGETVPGSEGAGLVEEGNYELKWKSEKGKPREYYLAKKD